MRDFLCLDFSFFPFFFLYLSLYHFLFPPPLLTLHYLSFFRSSFLTPCLSHSLVGTQRAGGTHQNNNNASAPQRSERPKAVKADKFNNIMEDSHSNGNGNSNNGNGIGGDRNVGMAAPRAGGNNNNRPVAKQNRKDDDDDFGDTDVSDLLG